nr:phosphate acyltransferase [Fervidobacterium pennivorans]
MRRIFLSIRSFEDIESVALSLHEDFSIGLIWPDKETLRAVSKAMDVNFGRYTAIGPDEIPGCEHISASNPEMAVEIAIDLAFDGKCDILVKGNINTHKLLKRIVHSPIKSTWVSHVSVLEFLEMGKILIVSDGTVTPDPTIEQKIMITKNAIDFASELGIRKPKVALIAANELVLDELIATKESATIANMFQTGKIKSEALVSGPVPLDVAISVAGATKKHVDLSFDPPADILICHNLEAAAAIVKTAVHLAHFKVAGVVLGTSKPIALTSRSDDWMARLISIYLCAILVARKRRKQDEAGLHVG